MSEWGVSVNDELRQHPQSQHVKLRPRIGGGHEDTGRRREPVWSSPRFGGRVETARIGEGPHHGEYFEKILLHQYFQRKLLYILIGT